MKKFKCLMMAMLMTTTMSGCFFGGDDEAETIVAPNDISADGIDAKITVQAEASWVPHYEAAVARVLAENPLSEIEIIEIGPFDVFDLIDSTSITNKDIPDVFAIPLDRIYGMAQNEVLATIDAPAMAAKLGGWDNFDGGLGGAFKIDGHYLAFPFNIESLIVYANTANAKAHGIDIYKPIEFSDLEYQDMLSVVHDAWFGVSFTNAVDLNLLGMSPDGTFTSDLTKNFSQLTTKQQEFFTTLYDYWKDHYDAATDLWDKSAAWGYVDAAFTTGGPTSIRIDGPWAAPAMAEKTNNGADLEILPLDQVLINGDPLTHWKSGWGLAINARIEEDPNKMALAQELIMEIVNPDHAELLFETTGKILENVSVDEYNLSNLSPMNKLIIDATIESYDKAVARPLFTEWGQVWGTWQNALLSWSSTKPKNVEEAYAQVQASFKSMMAGF